MKKSLTFKSLCALLLVAIAIFGFAGCANNGAEANIVEIPASSCVQYLASNTTLALDQTYTYTSDYGSETFTVTSNGTVTYASDYGSTAGTLCCAFQPTGYNGTMIFIKTSTHTNYGHYQYPDYDEDNPHSGCYTAFYLSDISSTSVTFASAVFYTGLEAANNPGNSYACTTCADSFDNLKALFETYGFESTCTAYTTTATRN